MESTTEENDYRIRNKKLINHDKIAETSITFIGCGGIGSYTIPEIVRMGFTKLIVYDDDNVGPENIGVQNFYPYEIGKNKAEALAERIKRDFDIEIKPIARRFNGNTKIVTDILISGVDSMNSRDIIWKKGALKSRNLRLYIDGRMSSQANDVYCVDMIESDLEQYEKSLFSDDKALREECTAKSIPYTPMNIASNILKQIKHYVNNEKNNYIIITDLEHEPFVQVVNQQRKE